MMIKLTEEHQRLVYEHREKSGLSLQESRKVILKQVVKDKIDQIGGFRYRGIIFPDTELEDLEDSIESALYDIADVLETILEEF